MRPPDDRPAATWSLRRSLTRTLLLSALLPVFAFGLALVLSQWQRDREDLILRLATSTQSSQSTFDDVLDGYLAGVQLLAEGQAATASPPDIDLELQRLLAAYPSVLCTLATDGEGRVVASHARAARRAIPAGTLVAGQDWFRRPRAHGVPLASDAYREPACGSEPLVAVSAPVLRDGVFAGVVQASLPVERLVRQRSLSLRRRGFELLVLDRADRVVYASPGLRLRFMDDTGSIGAAIRSAAAAPGESVKPQVVHGVLAEDGRSYVDAVRMRTGWVVAVAAPKQNLLAPSLPRLGLMLGLLAVTTLGILLALWRIRRLLVSSMGRLLASLHGYALGGTLDPRQLSRMPEEMQPLAGGIGDLAARMNAAYGELRWVLDEREHVIAERTESLREAVAKLDRLTRTDALTGCLNYRGFQEESLRLWQAAAETGAAFAVLAIDIDHFKAYNDHYGHLHGDGALKRFAGAVRSALLHPDDVLARQGGEEFAVLLPGANEAQARLAAARIRERLREADIAHAMSAKGRLTASIGIAAMAAGESVPLGTLLTGADAALYRAKDGGRDRAAV